MARRAAPRRPAAATRVPMPCWTPRLYDSRTNATFCSNSLMYQELDQALPRLPGATGLPAALPVNLFMQTSIENVSDQGIQLHDRDLAKALRRFIQRMNSASGCTLRYHCCQRAISVRRSSSVGTPSTPTPSNLRLMKRSPSRASRNTRTSGSLRA